MESIEALRRFFFQTNRDLDLEASLSPEILAELAKAQKSENEALPLEFARSLTALTQHAKVRSGADAH